jgi:protein-disulfide isomerase
MWNICDGSKVSGYWTGTPSFFVGKTFQLGGNLGLETIYEIISCQLGEAE